MTVDLIASFCEYHHSYHSISADRARVQEQLLRRLEAFLDGDISNLSSRSLEAFLAAQTVAPSTILKYLKMIRPFATWLWKNEHLSADQLLQLRGVQAPRGASWGEPRPYTRQEIACFWDEFEKRYPWTKEADPADRNPRRGEYWVRRWQASPDPWEWYRLEPYARRLQAEAIVTLALFGGLRRIEIFNLSLEDMNYASTHVRVVGARKNPAGAPVVRVVGWADPMREAVANWVEFRAQVLRPEHERPWLALRHGNLSPMSLSTLGHMLGRVGKGYSLHRLRHTFATERLRNNMNVEILKQAMGHSDISMTLRYAQIGDEDVVLATEQSNDKFTAAVGRGEG